MYFLDKVFRVGFVFTVLIYCSESYGVVLPRKLHYIWMGNSIKAQYLKNIVDFSKVNSDYAVKVWTDRPALFAGLPKSIKIENFDRIFSAMPKKLLEQLYHEIQARDYVDSKNKLPPNFAAASDILRIEILKREGGIYLDSDISIQEEKTEIDIQEESKGISQKQESTSGRFGDVSAPLGYVVPMDVTIVGDTYSIDFNNHMMGAIQEHPVLDYIQDQITENYLKFQVASDVASELIFEGKKYGLTNFDGSQFVEKLKIHSDNFWSLKLGNYYFRYLLTHEITGLSVLYRLLSDVSAFVTYFGSFIEKSDSDAYQKDFQFLCQLKFPNPKNIHHDNKVLWRHLDLTNEISSESFSSSSSSSNSSNFPSGSSK